MTEKRHPILCVDFDGVINSYKSGFIKAHVIPDPPVPGALAFLRESLKHFDTNIFSSRTHQPGGLEAMKAYIHYYAVDENPAVLLQDDPWMNRLNWPMQKPPAFVTLDDRGWTFNGAFPSMEELLAFKPWWQK